MSYINRMNRLLTLVVLLVPAFLLGQDHVNLLVGTYTNNGKSKGIYVYDFNTVSGETRLKSETAGISNPSYLALSPDRRFVYAVNVPNPQQSAASAFTYEPETGKLVLLNTQLTGGEGPCHVVTDAKNRHVILANYAGGSLSVFKTNADGSLGKLVQLIQYEGNGPDKVRQLKPHAHSATFSLKGDFLLVQDLGTDKIHIYQYHGDRADTPLTPANPAFISTTPGGGPRHMTFSGDGKFVYLVQELSAKVQVFSYEDGTLKPVQEISMLAEGANGEVSAAAIFLSPDGRFLYASNRGKINDLCIYRVDAESGRLTQVANQPTLGMAPRNFAIAPDGRFLLVGNQNSNEVVVFKRDTQTGLLTDSGKRMEIGAPVCLLFDKLD